MELPGDLDVVKEVVKMVAVKRGGRRWRQMIYFGDH